MFKRVIFSLLFLSQVGSYADEEISHKVLIQLFIAGVDKISDDYHFGSVPLLEIERKALLEIIADQSFFSDGVKQAAFKTLCLYSPKTEPHYII